MIMFLMLQLQSFSKLALVLLTAPLGLIGVSLFLLVFNQPVRLRLAAGRDRARRHDHAQLGDPGRPDRPGHRRRPQQAWDAVIDATVRRARPILLTAGTAIFAMIPLSRSVFWGPMAVALMGGLLVATALTLLFLPALYAAWFRVRQPAATPALAEVGGASATGPRGGIVLRKTTKGDLQPYEGRWCGWR